MVPPDNKAIYELLYEIEVGLREFLIEAFESNANSKWWKQRLPPDIRRNSKEAQIAERRARWSSIVPHHPIYYVDFPDLKKVIAQNDNWSEIFQSTFGRKDILESTLSELEPIRNKIAHNRKTTQVDLDIVQAAYRKVVSPIGNERFQYLVSKCTYAQGLGEILQELMDEASCAVEACQRFERVKNLSVWETTEGLWWFDSEFLSNDIQEIVLLFQTLKSYDDLPRSRGTGHRIEAWVKQQNIPEKYRNAMREFLALLADVGD